MIDYQHMKDEEKLKLFKHITNWVSTEYSIKMGEVSKSSGLNERDVANMRGGFKVLKDEHFELIFGKYPDVKDFFLNRSKDNQEDLPSNKELISLLRKVLILTERLGKAEKENILLKVELEQTKEA